MKTVIHRNKERGVGEHGWLHTRFSFSFAHWYNPERMGFGALRVLNDDIIDADSGFDTHPHANMEIITIVTKGAVTHGDSMGHSFDVPAGDVQVMSAGTGVLHSEQNNSLHESLELFQIWIEPGERNITPRYDQKSFGLELKRNEFELLVSSDGRNDSLQINQDAFVYRGVIDEGKSVSYTLNNKENGVYIFIVKGSVVIGESDLDTRDAIGVWDVENVDILAKSEAEVLIFEVPM